MSHLQLIASVVLSYAASLWGFGRWRRFRRRVSARTHRALAQPDVARVLAVAAAAGPADAAPLAVWAALEERLNAGDFAGARALLRGGIDPAPQAAALAGALLSVIEASAAPGPLSRHRAAAAGLRAARQARPLGAAAEYLEAILLLAFLRDELTADLRLWQARRLLARGLRRSPADPLLHLAEGLRWATAGAPGEAVAALGRALYHGRGDPFVAGRLLAAPLVEELSPGLAAEARRALAAATG